MTYGWPKLGQVLPPGRDYVGRLWQADIGIPPILAREAPLELAEARGLRPFCAPTVRQQQGELRPPAAPGGLLGKTGGRPWQPRRPSGPGPGW